MRGLECAPDQDIIIIGATGSLARTRLLPALYNLAAQGLLPEKGRIIGFARTQLDDARFKELAREAISATSPKPLDEEEWSAFASRLCYSPLADGFGQVAARETEATRLIYLAIPPSAFPETVEALGKAGLAQSSRLIVEKPFGHDLKSSRELERVIHEVFKEPQVFRIDHYLGKETVQNILVFRFGNAVFERVWNRDSVDHVQVTVAESIGIEGRGAFYEETGALRDVLQNHLLQVVSMLTMEAPAVFRAESVRDEKAKLFHAMRPLRREDVVRGQYTAGTENGASVPGYREEPGVDPRSHTETFVAARLFIDNWRWAGVPFFIRTGKRLRRHTTEVAVVFREPPVMFFKQTPVDRLKPNMLNISIQPAESISFQFLAKVPGPEIQVDPVDMQFRYEEAFKKKPAEAYERLLHDAFCNDPTLFARDDVIDRAWEVVQPVLNDMPRACPYPAGSWGPEEANTLISPRLWHPR